MYATTTFLAAALAMTSSVSAHGYLKYVDYKGVSYGLWDVFSDPFIKPSPYRYDRKYADNGPVVGMTGPNITCNNGPNDGSGVGSIDVKAGDTLKLVWDQWGSSHSGPVMTYMAKCTPNCATFKANTGTPWFKIDQMGYDTTKSPPWASDYLAKQGAWWDVTIPPTIAAGEYLLRHEILGLHVAGTVNGAQFYPSCVHLKVSGGGSDTPSGVALPGAYDPNDTDGILVQLWRVNQGQVKYIAPGGPVWSKAAPGPQSAATAVAKPYKPSVYAPSASGGAAPTTPAAPTTTVRPPTSTSKLPVDTTSIRTTTSASATRPPVTTTAAAGGAPASAWAQCGGNGTPDKTCVSGYKCSKINEFYSQCVPA